MAKTEGGSARSRQFFLFFLLGVQFTIGSEELRASGESLAPNVIVAEFIRSRRLFLSGLGGEG